MNTLLWLQRDLRTRDNPSLNWALEQQSPVIAVYVYSPGEDGEFTEGAASRWWLHHSLIKLTAALQELNIQLLCIKGNSVEVIPELAAELNAQTIVWTNRYEPYRVECESSIENTLKSKNLEVRRFTDGLLEHPDTFLTASKNTPYRVFTPFYKKLRSQLPISDYYSITKRKLKQSPSMTLSSEASNTLTSHTLEKLNLLDQYPWHKKLNNFWTPGELSAGEKLEVFIDEALSHYSVDRDIPSVMGTSNLSPHLHFGEITPQQIIRTLIPVIEMNSGVAAEQVEAFMRQLIWREFARYIIWHFPHTISQPMNPHYKSSFWKKNKNQLQQWQQGNTGIAIVDAGMKQLWETGWMHNRVRMLVASLLTKNMGIHWQQGAQWFWDTLVDADLANNTMGWQWVAGCGVDAAPYFRIFNPDTQAQKFDRKYSYIKRWTTSDEPLQPIVDLSSSRQQALDRYKEFVKQKN